MKDDGNEKLDLEALKVGWREVGVGVGGFCPCWWFGWVFGVFNPTRSTLTEEMRSIR